MIWIIGGTKETFYLVERISKKVDYVVTVATYAGKEVLKDKNTIVSRLNYKNMIEFISRHNIKKIVDMSHPYAEEVTLNAKRASKECNIEYIRYVREKAQRVKESKTIYVEDIEACLNYLKEVKGTVLFTTGIKNITDFEGIKGNNRFIYRVLPSKFSIEECVNNNIDMKNIIAILGPFSEEFNLAMFKQYNPDYVVMKDSGNIGGTFDKLSACEKLGIKSLIIGRKDEEGIKDIDKLVEMII